MGPGLLTVEVSISHTIRHTHTHPVGLLWTNDQSDAEADTYTKHDRLTFVGSVKFEPAIPAIKRLQTYTLDGTATEIGQMPSLLVA